jgi:DNA polymerase-4
VGRLALVPEDALSAMLGPGAGRHLHALAHNRDPRSVHVRRRRGSIGSQRARRHSRWSIETADADLVALVDRVARRLRAAGRVGRTVVLRLRFEDFTRATRSHTLTRPTAGTAQILTVARALLAAAVPEIEARGLTLVGISVANLDDVRAVQLCLPLEGDDPEALDAALDQVRDRFGSAAITRGVLVGRDPGITMPLLPD